MNQYVKLFLAAVFLLVVIGNVKAQSHSWQDSLYWFNQNAKEQLNEKPVILEFWATWCGACIEAMPHINQLTKEFKDEIGFLSVNSYDTKKRINQFLKKKKMLSFVVLDETKHLANLMNVQNIPLTILLDAKGEIRWKGTPSELTSEMLAGFISNDSIAKFKKPTSGVIIDTVLTLTENQDVHFSFKLSYGDLTKGKGVTFPKKEEFHVGLLNRPIENMLMNIYSQLETDCDWRFEGNVPKGFAFNVKAESESTESEHELLEELVKQLSFALDFSIIPTEEMQEIWFLEAEKDKQNLLLSQYATEDPIVKTVVEDIVFTNVPTVYLTNIISRQLKVKVRSNFNSEATFDFIIPITDDIIELKAYLKKKYDVNLIAKQVTVKVNKVVFR